MFLDAPCTRLFSYSRELLYSIFDVPLVCSGWGEPYAGPQKAESSSWAEPAVDIGTSAWGKPMDSGSSWEEPGREKTGNGWSSQSQHKPGENENKSNVYIRVQYMIVLRKMEWCVLSRLNVSYGHHCVLSSLSSCCRTEACAEQLGW